jgi:hypothetical protein
VSGLSNARAAAHALWIDDIEQVDLFLGMMLLLLRD